MVIPEPQAIPALMVQEVVGEMEVRHFPPLTMIPDKAQGAVPGLAAQVPRPVLRERRALRGIQAPRLRYFVCHFVAEQGAPEGTQVQPVFLATREAVEVIGRGQQVVTEVPVLRVSAEGGKEETATNIMYVLIALLLELCS